MPSRWVEGIHYEKLESGSLRCLKCQKVISSLPGLGPHLATCFQRESKGPTPEAPLEPSVTMQDQLRQYLSEVGFKRVDAVVTLAERYGYNVLGLYAALKDANANLSTIRYVLKAWASYNNEPIPEWILREINANPIPGGIQAYMPPQAESETLKREDFDKWWAEKQKEQEIQQLRAEIEMLKRGNIENPQKSEVQALREELQKMRQDEVLDRLKRLENYVHGPISNIYGLLGLTVKELSDVIRTSPLRWYLATGQPYPYEQKEVEEEARQSIFSRLPSRYVAEE